MATVSLLIHPKIEPGVIDNAMITRCIENYGPKGEAGRLMGEEGTHINEVSVIRLEFQNIIRIDHLWMLKSLTKLSLAQNSIERIENLENLQNLIDLDLSFNMISKIENLSSLNKLEVLSLFSNHIKKLENLDGLENLFIFSIGNNMIEDYKEVIYMRQFRHLRSFCIKGNPCCDNEMAYDFFMSGLPKIRYLDYKCIQDNDREKGKSIFRGLLKNLDEADENTKRTRIAKEKYDSDVKFYALSFVEYLHGPELLEKMFVKDVEGQMLMQFGGELHGYFEQYKETYVKLMDELVEFAQEAYIARKDEIAKFEDLMKGTLEKSILESKTYLVQFDREKALILEEMNEIIFMFTNKMATLQMLEPRVMDLGERFNDLLFSLWKKLMLVELILFEKCEESRVQFSVNLTHKVNILQEVARDTFGKWREFDQDWTAKQMELLHKFIGNKTLLGLLDSNSELHEILLDRDSTVDAVAQSSDNHMRFIDAREDILMTRAIRWKDEVVSGINENEVKRNRARVLEINYFMDYQRQEWMDMQMTLTDVPDAETIAILGDVMAGAYNVLSMHCH